MQTILPSQLRRGMVLVLDGAPHAVEEVLVAGTGQAKHRVHAQLRHLASGHHSERGFLDSDHLLVADAEHRRIMFSYREGEDFVFTDGETFEEVRLSEKQVGERRWFLKENEEYPAVFLEGRPLDLQLPDHLALRVVETAAAQRGGQQSTLKPAKLEGGLEVMVPLFIGVGETVRVDTRTRRYAGKE
jgi:elongation factor P